MKLCGVCKKNVAVAYMSKFENGKPKMEGVCIECAKKMGLPVIDQIMNQTKMSPQEVENLTEQMNSLFQDIDLDGEDPNNLLANFFTGEGSETEEEVEEVEEAEDVEETKSTKKESSSNKNKDKKKSKKKKYLDTYGINLTERAKNGQIDPVIGRSREIDRVIQILNRRTKNNPILIGEPGVGKTAIAEGLAVRMAEKQVPAKFFDGEVYLLDLTAVVAGTQFRGQFEGRMKSIIKEAMDYGNIIIVIDEVHNIMGAGEVHGGVMNAANILKPALARGEIQIIGATTLEEYRKHIEKDAALERRFQPVIVEEPSIDEAIEILKGLKSHYENFHMIKISDEVIEAAVKLSERYISDRYLPDKAIDVIDEAGSRANLKNKGLVEIEALKEELNKVRDLKEEASLKSNYELAAQYKVEEVRLEGKIKDIEKESLDVELTVEDVAFVIESWTKIPVRSITQEEAEKLIKLDEKLHQRVIGQDEAIKSLARTIRRNRAGFRKRKKPASFVFVGPTGVGKTELVRALATELFGSEEAMIRVDMSEYMEKHTVSKLIGAPPGYVGFDEGGQLTEKVRRKPYSVILLDEIEKAHPDVFNMLLQILEDGRLTDSQGRTVFFENTVIIMTSNVGSHLKSHGMGFGADNYNALESKVKEGLKEIFRPEFLNRIDEIIAFKKLSKEELKKIIDLMLKEVEEEVGEKDMKLEVSEEAKDFILEKGYDSQYGARPLRRTIQRYLEDEIAELYIQKAIKEGDHIKASLEDDKIKIVNVK